MAGQHTGVGCMRVHARRGPSAASARQSAPRHEAAAYRMIYRNLRSGDSQVRAGEHGEISSQNQWLTKRSQLAVGGFEQSSAICCVWTVPGQGRKSCPIPALFGLFLLAGVPVIWQMELTGHDLLEAGSLLATLQHLRLC